MIRFIPLILALLAVACIPTRDPSPVGMKQPHDDQISCQSMAAEYYANTASAAAKIEKNRSDDGKDFLLGAFVWPGLVDLKNADGTEGNALLDRNLHLRELAGQKACNTTDWPAQPERYD